jgi:hypothetical protein
MEILSFGLEFKIIKEAILTLDRQKAVESRPFFLCVRAKQYPSVV